MKTFAIAALIGAASAFPSFDSFHAHCQIEVTVEKSCSETLSLLSDYVKSGRDAAIEEVAFDYAFALKITDKLNT